MFLAGVKLVVFAVLPLLCDNMFQAKETVQFLDCQISCTSRSKSFLLIFEIYFFVISHVSRKCLNCFNVYIG